MAHITTPRGVSINYETFGDPDNPPLLLIQGLGAHMIGWRHQLCRLIADRGFYVIRFDNRDTGLSQHFPDQSYTLADMMEDSVGLLEALNVESAHVVGQSMGGMIAQQLALDHANLVSSHTIIYSAPSTDYITGVDIVQERMERRRARNREEAVSDYLINEAPCASTAYEQDTGWLTELGGLMFDRSYDPDGIQRQADAMIRAPHRSPRLEEIQVPTVLMHGDSDKLISHQATIHMHELIPHSTLKIFPGMGHEIPQPLWNEITDLITQNASREMAHIQSE